MSEPGNLLIEWSVRLSLLLYVLALVLRLTSRENRQRTVWGRMCWTAGALLLVLHILSAFHFTHHWSHADAYRVTARDTAAVVGLNWGGGLYINYLFAVIWLTDAAWWWRSLEGYERRAPIIDWAVQGFLGFIIFNATVVFKTGAVRWCGVVITLLLLALLALHRSHGRTVR